MYVYSDYPKISDDDDDDDVMMMMVVVVVVILLPLQGRGAQHSLFRRKRIAKTMKTNSSLVISHADDLCITDYCHSVGIGISLFCTHFTFQGNFSCFERGRFL